MKLSKSTASELRFAKNIYIALCGETIDETVSKKLAIEKELIIQRLIKVSDLTNKQISKILDVPKNLVKKTRKEIKAN